MHAWLNECHTTKVIFQKEHTHIQTYFQHSALTIKRKKINNSHIITVYHTQKNWQHTAWQHKKQPIQHIILIPIFTKSESKFIFLCLKIYKQLNNHHLFFLNLMKTSQQTAVTFLTEAINCLKVCQFKNYLQEECIQKRKVKFRL